MKRLNQGASLYYASDKNIFDALNNSKVDIATIFKLFATRNIVVSNRTPREELAKYFARLTHDYFDHKDISTRLGVISRQERITSMEINGEIDKDQLTVAVNTIKSDLESYGDIVHITRKDDKLSINIQYSEFDYKLAEFSQLRIRDGNIDFIETAGGYIVRNTQNEYLNNIRETLLAKLDSNIEEPTNKVVISLFDIPDLKLRSRFFYDLIDSDEHYTRQDVTKAYVYKIKPDSEKGDQDDDDEEVTAEDFASHVERVYLRGNGVTQSEIFNDLLTTKEYYIVNISWTIKEKLKKGHIYDIEAVFDNPKDCTGFSFLLKGVFAAENNGKISLKRRPPTKDEVDSISVMIENKARSVMTKLKDEYNNRLSREKGGGS